MNEVFILYFYFPIDLKGNFFSNFFFFFSALKSGRLVESSVDSQKESSSKLVDKPNSVMVPKRSSRVMISRRWVESV